MVHDFCTSGGKTTRSRKTSGFIFFVAMLRNLLKQNKDSLDEDTFSTSGNPPVDDDHVAPVAPRLCFWLGWFSSGKKCVVNKKVEVVFWQQLESILPFWIPPYLYSRNLFDTKHVNFKRSHLWPLKNLCSNLLDKSPYKTSPNFTPRVQYVNSASNKSERSDAGSPRAKRITVLAWSVQVKQLIHRISDLLLGGSPHLVDG